MVFFYIINLNYEFIYMRIRKQHNKKENIYTVFICSGSTV